MKSRMAVAPRTRRRTPRAAPGLLVGALLLGAACAPAEEAVFALEGGTLFVRTPRYEATIEAACLTSLKNRLTGEVYARRLPRLAERLADMPQGLGLRPAAPDAADLRMLTALHAGDGDYGPEAVARCVHQVPADAVPVLTRLGPDRVRLAWRGLRGGDGSAFPDETVTLEVSVLPGSGDLQIEGAAESPRKGVYGIGVGLLNFSRDLTWVLTRMESVEVHPSEEPVDARTRVRHWPRPWTSSLLVAEGAKGSVGLWMTDPELGDRYLHWRNREESFDVLFESVNHAPFDAYTRAPSRTIRVNVYEGNWVPAARAYRDHWEKTFGVKPIDERGPAWLRDIRGMTGASYSLPPAEHRDRCAAWAPQRWKVMPTVGDKGLFPYDIEKGPELHMIAPLAEELRGDDAHLMVYLNISHMNEGHPWAPRFWDYRRRSVFGESTAPRSPVEGAKNSFVVNCAHRPWQDLVVGWAAQSFERFGLCGFYMDCSTGVPNTGGGLIDGRNNLQGELELMKRMKERIPGCFLGCEYTTDLSAQVVDFGMYGKDNWPWLGDPLERGRTVHPLGGFLYNRYVHLFRGPNPAFYEVLGRLPGPSFREPDPADVTDYAPRTTFQNRFFELQASTLMRPEYPVDWDPAVRMYYRGRDGTPYRIYSEIRPEGRMMKVLPDGGEEMLYWRIVGRGRAALPPSFNVEGWIAYDGDTAIGLCPEQTYLAVPGDRIPDWRVTSLPPGVFIRRARPYRDGLLVLELDTPDGRPRAGGLELEAAHALVAAGGSGARLEPLAPRGERRRYRLRVEAPGAVAVSAAAPLAVPPPGGKEPALRLAAVDAFRAAYHEPNGVRAVMRKGTTPAVGGGGEAVRLRHRDARAATDWLVALPGAAEGGGQRLRFTARMEREDSTCRVFAAVNGRPVFDEPLASDGEAVCDADLAPWAGRTVLLSLGTDEGKLRGPVLFHQPRVVASRP